MRKIFLIMMILSFLSVKVSPSLAEQSLVSEEQMKQITEEVKKYADETYKREGGKRSKQAIEEDFIEGSKLKALNSNASEAFTKGNFNDCKMFTDIGINDIEEYKKHLKTMSLSREQWELAYFVAADCRMMETMKKVSAAKNASLAETFQKERAEVEKAKNYYIKVSKSAFNSTMAAIGSYNLAFINMALGEKKKGQEYYAEAFKKSEQVLNFIKEQKANGKNVLFIWHNDTSYLVNN